MIVRELDIPPRILRDLAARHPDRYPVLFDSAAEGPLSRASVLVARPSAALWLDAQQRLHAEGAVPRGVWKQGTGFLSALERWVRHTRASAPAGSAGAAARLASPPFAGGWAVLLGYEIAAEIEPRLLLPPSLEPYEWRSLALRVPCALVHDRLSGRVQAIAEEDAAESLDAIIEEAHACARAGVTEPTPGPLEVAHVREEEPAAYLERVRRGKDYIRAGDIYQTNLSRSWRVELREADVGRLYERLRLVNPAPFAALAQWRGAAVLSSSPERLVRVAERRIETRPIAGTRPRSRRPGEDARETAALVAHPKERAEHIMLIDLERNDLGRVCDAGTVRVEELMSIESYAHVHHIVSSVTGVLRQDVTLIEALRAVFPGGTITGCPKFRCMQIIAELEGEGRGNYTGSLGLIGRDGAMDFNILIRTMTLVGRAVEFRAGAGIVADSDPERELEETRAKARGLLAAFGAAPRAGAAA
ncbi:MAG TPA: aminodeoxychorismate synthase component I [Steroidobacteraceae bacterium]|nr:aminodeoxychorismate synthase component I [Steroidobacteraceae bacterium]